jgi:hypothetical protein
MHRAPHCQSGQLSARLLQLPGALVGFSQIPSEIRSKLGLELHPEKQPIAVLKDTDAKPSAIIDVADAALWGRDCGGKVDGNSIGANRP